MKARTIVIFALIGIFLVACGAYAECKGTCCDKAAKIKVLYLVGGGFHDNPDVYNLFKPMLESTGKFTVTLTKDLDQFKAANIKNYDLVAIYATRLDFTPEQEKGLTDFVRNGGGIVGIHSGATDTFRNSDAFWKMMGGRFTKHGHLTFKVHVTAARHSIMQGVSDFDINDESYTDDFNPEAKVIVLMRREMDNEPSVWVQYYGKGRVFATGLGHDKEAWENPGFKAVVERGSLWAAGKLNP